MIEQFLVNGIIAGSVYLLVALGFALVYRAVHFFYFGHAIIFTCGAYFTLMCKEGFGLPLYFAIPISIILCVMAGCLMEFLIYRQLRHKESGETTNFIASMGIYIVLQNVISILFGDNMQTIRSGNIAEGLGIWNAIVTPVQIYTIVTAIGLMLFVALVLKYTKIGITMRAVANAPKLAHTAGIDSEKVFLWTFAVGSALAAVAGVLVSLDTDMTPTMGMNALMMALVAVIIGGVNSIYGIALGALFLGTAQQLSACVIGSQWKDAIAFVILVLFLLFRPEGFFGKKIKSSTV